jgi:hypothetical protein
MLILYRYVFVAALLSAAVVCCVGAKAAVSRYTAADNLNLRSGPQWDMPSTLPKGEYIPTGAVILAWQDEPCRPSDSAREPYGPKDYWCPVYYKNPANQISNGWVNAYYLLLSDGVRMGERFALNQEDDGARKDARR